MQQPAPADDSAWIDSFFLPGGILDPDLEEEEEQQQCKQQESPTTLGKSPSHSQLFPSTTATTGATTAIPKNPWANDQTTSTGDGSIPRAASMSRLNLPATTSLAPLQQPYTPTPTTTPHPDTTTVGTSSHDLQQVLTTPTRTIGSGAASSLLFNSTTTTPGRLAAAAAPPPGFDDFHRSNAAVVAGLEDDEESLRSVPRELQKTSVDGESSTSSLSASSCEEQSKTLEDEFEVVAGDEAVVEEDGPQTPPPAVVDLEAQQEADPIEEVMPHSTSPPNKGAKGKVRETNKSETNTKKNQQQEEEDEDDNESPDQELPPTPTPSPPVITETVKAPMPPPPPPTLLQTTTTTSTTATTAKEEIPQQMGPRQRKPTQKSSHHPRKQRSRKTRHGKKGQHKANQTTKEAEVSYEPVSTPPKPTTPVWEILLNALWTAVTATFSVLTIVLKTLLVKSKKFAVALWPYLAYIYQNFIRVLAKRITAALSLVWIMCTSIFYTRQSPQLLDVVLMYATIYCLPILLHNLLRFVDMPHWMPQLIITINLWQCCSVDDDADHQDSWTATGEAATKSTVSSNKNTKNNTNTDPTSQPARKTTPLERMPMEQRQQWLSVLRGLLLQALLMDGFTSEMGLILGCATTTRLYVAYILNMIILGWMSSSFLWTIFGLQWFLPEWLPGLPFMDFWIFCMGIGAFRFQLAAYRNEQKEKSR